MQAIEAVLERAEAQCRERGTRLTEKRKKVLSGLLMSDKALSAYELVEFCNRHFDESFAAMSVYRILDFLEEEQLVHKLNLANCYVACTHICCDHAHEVPQFLICTNCRRVEEFSINDSMLADLCQQVERANYQLLSPQLELNCLCEACHQAG